MSIPVVAQNRRSIATRAPGVQRRKDRRMSKRKLVLVGNGMAGMRAIEELLKLEPEMYDITVFGSEPHGNYNRILLSPVLAAEKTVADIMLNTREWYAENGITLHAGDEVVRIDRARRRVVAKSGLTA